MNINKVIKKIDIAIVEIEKAIATYDKFSLFTTINQLNNFKEKLINLRNIIESGDIPQKTQRHLGMARVITDQWPFDNKLGNIIIDAELTYKNA
ncbi:hypothetical protein [Xenorhabdus khoisanae]|uniref:hypothetical protein n=1 Tax=Xenorhabdus khoisanae TaxID=880157 RepID=UPI00069D09F6|nr:hypothetical protein [Xenorhabdus khoisanae]